MLRTVTTAVERKRKCERYLEPPPPQSKGKAKGHVKDASNHLRPHSPAKKREKNASSHQLPVGRESDRERERASCLEPPPSHMRKGEGRGKLPRAMTFPLARGKNRLGAITSPFEKGKERDRAMDREICFEPRPPH